MPSPKLRGSLRFIAGLGLLALLLFALGSSPRELLEQIQGANFNASALGLAFVFTILCTWVIAFRWRLIDRANHQGAARKLPLSSYFYALILTRFLGQFTSSVAMDLIGRGVALRSAGSQKSVGHIGLQVFFERLFDLFLPFVLLGWVWGVYRLQLPEIESLVVLLMVFCGVAQFAFRPVVFSSYRFANWLRDKWKNRKKNSQDTEKSKATVQPNTGDDSQIDCSPALVASLTGLSILRFAIVTAQFTAIAWSFGIELSPLKMLQATPVAQIAGMLGFTPGGLGVQEAGWAGALHWLSVPRAEISLFILAQRPVLISFFGILTAASWLIHQKYKHKTSDPAP